MQCVAMFRAMGVLALLTGPPAHASEKLVQVVLHGCDGFSRPPASSPALAR